MKIKLALAALLLIGLGNCGPEPKNETDPQTCDEQCQATKTILKASFVSGHLGNYSDCPEDGYSAKAAPAAGDQAVAAGQCQEGVECQPINNCEKASAILRLSNGGDHDAVGILVQKIELKNEAGDTVATLPLESVTLVENNQQFSGKVGVDETPSIRIDFQGPVNAYELLSGSGGGTADFAAQPGGVLHITLTADNADDVIIISPVTSSIPSVST